MPSDGEVEDDVWCVVMFDLPVKTREQRRASNSFRHLLLDLGFWRAQLSVYVRYTPRAIGTRAAVESIKRNLPDGGEVRLIYVTDHQWAKALRFFRGSPVDTPEQPTQLTIF